MHTFVWLNRACAVFLLCAATVIDSPAQTFTTLASFNGTDGNFPVALIQATDGNLYGATSAGGAVGLCPDAAGVYPGCGTIFKVTPAGTLTTLHSFNRTDGLSPNALIQAADGSFYGATQVGGSGPSCIPQDDCGGTIFKITAGGTLTTLYSFTGGSDGAEPNALIQGADGNLYGTTEYGGVGLCQEPYTGCGTVFKLTPGGTLTTLHSFNGTDGIMPGALIQAADGNLYGITNEGGPYASENGPCLAFIGCGTIFKITVGGTLTTLYSFTGGNDGLGPTALIQAADGNLYGITPEGGPFGVCPEPYIGCGTIFEITLGGALTTLHNFDWTDGLQPDALIQATDGNLYGTTAFGGVGSCVPSGSSSGCGTVFKITPGGTLTTLHSLDGKDGLDPDALIQGADGNLYGTTYDGASDDTVFNGTVFKLVLALPPSPTLSISGVVNAASYAKNANGQGSPVAPGSLIQIYATLPGANSASSAAVPLPTSLGNVGVTFNGILASLSAVTPTGAFPFINAQVPFEVLTTGPSATANVVVSVNETSSAPQPVPIVLAAPGIFTTAANGLGQAILVNLANLQIAAPSNPIPRGGTAYFYATGLGALTPSVADGSGTCTGSNGCDANSTPTVLIGGVTAPVLFAGQAPGYPGVNQINITIPVSAPTGNAVSLQIQTADGTLTTSDLVTISIQ